MTQEEIYAEAIGRIRERRRAAERLQETRTDQIRREIPETAELDNQLRSACLSITHVLGKGDNRAKLEEIARHSMEADAMLRKILAAHGYPEDYLDLHYSCTICDDTGFTGGKPCKCLEQEIGRVGAEALNARSQLSLSGFDDFSLSYYADLPTEQYYAMQQNLAVCQEYAADFSPERAGNLYLFGGTGLGKTHLSLAIANEVLKKGYNVIYDSAINLMHILDQEQFRRTRESGDTLPSLLECDLLILDDFGTEFDTAFSRSMLYTIINSRVNAHKPMIVNTNLTHQEVQDRYGDRILSRLISTSRILPFFGRDIRLRKKAETGNR